MVTRQKTKHRKARYQMPQRGPIIHPESDLFAVFEEAAQRRFGVSGEEFTRRFRAGEYGKADDWPTSDLLIMEGLLMSVSSLK